MKAKLIIDIPFKSASSTLTLGPCTLHELHSSSITLDGRKKTMRITEDDGYIIFWNHKDVTYDVIRPTDKYAGRYFWHPTGDRKVREMHSSHMVIHYSFTDWIRSESARYDPGRGEFWHAVRVVFDPAANWAFEPEAAISSLHYQEQAALVYFRRLEDDEPRDSIPVVYRKDEQPCYINQTFWLRPDYQLQPANAPAVYDLVLTHKGSPVLELPTARLLRQPYDLTDGRMVLVPTGTLPVEPFMVGVEDYNYNYAYMLKENIVL